MPEFIICHIFLNLPEKISNSRVWSSFYTEYFTLIAENVSRLGEIFCTPFIRKLIDYNAKLIIFEEL